MSVVAASYRRGMQRKPDPIGAAGDADEPYRMQVIKNQPYFRFSNNGVVAMDWKDDGEGVPFCAGFHP
ncbi:MAG: DUF1961 family protein [Pirellulaceae bacterium]